MALWRPGTSPATTVDLHRSAAGPAQGQLDTLQFLEMRPGSTPAGATELADFNSADLVTAYGESLGRLLREQLPALHDLARADHAMEPPALGRRPFPIQKQMIAAGLKLLAQGENPMVAAEVGTGKSTVSLAIAGCLSPEHFAHTAAELRRLGFDPSRLKPVRRLLILAPPHLLKSWQDQAAAVLPSHRVQIVEDLADLDRPAEIYVLSRERAKLGHGWRGLERPPRSAALPRQCPRCGRLVLASAENLATRRERCGAKRRLPTNPAAAIAEDLAVTLAGSYSFDPTVRSLLPNRTRLWRSLPEVPVLDEGEKMPTFGEPAGAKRLSIARPARAARAPGRGLPPQVRAGAGSDPPPDGGRGLARAQPRGAAGGPPLGEAEATLGRGCTPYSSEVHKPRRLAAEVAGLVEPLASPEAREWPAHPAALEALAKIVAPAASGPSPRRAPPSRCFRPSDLIERFSRCS